MKYFGFDCLHFTCRVMKDFLVTHSLLKILNLCNYCLNTFVPSTRDHILLNTRLVHF